MHEKIVAAIETHMAAAGQDCGTCSDSTQGQPCVLMNLVA